MQLCLNYTVTLQSYTGLADAVTYCISITADSVSHVALSKQRDYITSVYIYSTALTFLSFSRSSSSYNNHFFSYRLKKVENKHCYTPR
jgi:hypothetical protein